MQETVQQLFKKANKNYQKNKEIAESQVVSWHWSKHTMVEIEPYYHKKNNCAKGFRLDAEPTDKSYHNKYGVDKAGNVVVERDYNSIGSFYETFYQIEEHNNEKIITSFHYNDDDNKIILCIIYVLQKATLHDRYAAGKYSCGHTKYNYHNQILISEDSESLDYEQKKTSTQKIIYEYHDSGQIASIRENDFYFYQRKTGLNLAELTAKMQKITILAVEKYVRERRPTDKIFILHLGYGSEELYPITTAFGLESERKELVERYGRYDESIWDYAYYQYFDDCVDLPTEHEQYLAEFNQEMKMDDQEHLIRQVMINTAVDLKSRVSELGLNTTNDFVIVASAWEESDYKQNFKTINPERFAEFESYLPE